MHDDIKKYFNEEDPTIVNLTDIDSLGKEVESLNYLRAYVEQKERFVPHIDFSDPANFAKFGSAEQYYRDAIERIYKTYPYDGSLYERIAWHNSSSFFDNHVFDKEYPRTNGYIKFSADPDVANGGWGVQGTTSNLYSSSSVGEYIIFKGGPHPSNRGTGKAPNDKSGDYKSGYSNIFDQSENRESNLKIDGNDGNTVEFWMKKEDFEAGGATTSKMVIFDTYAVNGTTTGSSEYGRLRIETDASKDPSTSPFYVTYMSGNTGFDTLNIGNCTYADVADSKWHHYAFTFKSNVAENHSILFDGVDDFLNVGQPKSLNFDPDSDFFTLSAWIKTTAENGTIISLAEDGTAANAQYELYVASGYLAAVVGGNANTSVSNSTINDGNWHHCVLVSNTAAHLLYLDGVLQTDTGACGSTTKSGIDVLIGARRNGDNTTTGRLFDGNIDEVTVWSAALNANQVAELYNGELPAGLVKGPIFADPRIHSAKANLVHYWNMGESIKKGENGKELKELVSGVHNAVFNNFSFDSKSGPVSDSPFSADGIKSGHLTTKLYIDGYCNDTKEIGNHVDYVSGSMLATIGALATAPSGTTTPTLGWGKFSGSLDDFRFWKVARNSKQIAEHWFVPVGGGTNTDTANTHLGVYYKFNEGITEHAATDATVLDYSGRISNGDWYGYTSVSRNTGSAMVSSSFASASYEFEDPILYSHHSSVNNYLTASVLKGKNYDYANNAGIYHSYPNWIIEEDTETEENLKKLTQIIASYFDSLQLQTEELPKLKNVNYISSSHKPYSFSNKILEDKGFIAPELFPDADILEQFLNQSDKELFIKKLYDVKNRIYQNIYNNLVYIYKSKGTEKSIRNLIRTFGVDHELLKVNLYGNNATYTFDDKYRHVGVRTKTINFNNPDRFNASVYQMTASDNDNSVSYLSGSPDADIPFTAEGEFIFPKKFGVGTRYHKAYEEMSSSLFGMHAAVQADPADLTTSALKSNTMWHPQDPANFQVYAARKSLADSAKYGQGLTNKDVFFLLTGSNIGGEQFPPGLSSSIFRSVYENEKWNFAVSIKPTEYPMASGVTGTLEQASVPPDTYTIEFYGVNMVSDHIVNSFITSSTVSQTAGERFLTSSKRFYVGAHRTDFTGSILTSTDVKAVNARCWMNYLTSSVINAHARDPKNFGALHPYKHAYMMSTLKTGSSGKMENETLAKFHIPEIETLVLDWDFETVTGSGDSSDSSPATSDAKFVVEDVSSGSLDRVHIYGNDFPGMGNILEKQHTGRGDFFLPFDTGSVSKDYISVAKTNLPENLLSSDTVNILERDDEVFTRESLPVTHFYAVEKSMYQTISEEMLNMFATIIDFNNLVGEPVNRYRQDYKDLGKLRQLFYEKVGNEPDLEKFVEYYKWIDSALSKMIAKIIPASSRFANSLRNMIESHVLERNKYWTKFPTLEKKPPLSIGILKNEFVPVPPEKITQVFFPPSEAAVMYSQQVIPCSGVECESPCVIDRDRNYRFIRTLSPLEPLLSTNAGDVPDSTLRAVIDNNRDVFTTVKKRATNRTNRGMVGFSTGYTHNIHGGVNDRAYTLGESKRIDITKTLFNEISGSENVGLEITSEVVSIPPRVVNFRDGAMPWQDKFKLHYVAGQIQKRGEVDTTDYFGDIYGKFVAPFSMFSSSVSTGYNAFLRTRFSIIPHPGAVWYVDFANLHHDVYGPDYETPMQGPFTEKWVGGHPHRHVMSQFTSNATSLDSESTRPEAWILEFKSDADGRHAVFRSPISASVHNPRSTIWKGTKSPVNIENIRTTTGSSGYSNPGNSTKIGNYTNDYDIVQTSGRGTNNRYFVKNEGIDLDWQDDQKISAATPIRGVSHFTAIDRSVSGSNKYVFAERFSAPGGPDTMCESFLDIESGEKSPYNALPFRNLIVRMPLYELLTNHVKQFGLHSDTQFSSSWDLAIRDGIKAINTYPGMSGTISALTYETSASFYNTVNRNTKKSIRYSNEYTGDLGTTMTASTYDNWWVWHPIPQCDRQYQWISASSEITEGNVLFGYQKPNYKNASMGSTDIPFIGESTNHVSNYRVDFARMNTLIYDPLIETENLLSTSLGDYRNTTFATLTQPDDLNALLLHRNGPYQYAPWQQARSDNNPVRHLERKINTISINNSTEKTKELLHFTESVVTTRYLPMKHILQTSEMIKPVEISHTYGNNLVSVNSNKLEQILDCRPQPGTQTYDKLRKLYMGKAGSEYGAQLFNFVYQENIWPREVNTFLGKVRGRENYLSLFWDDEEEGRVETNIANSQGQTISTQSKWPLDARKEFATSETYYLTASTQGSGELNNMYSLYHTGSNLIIPAALYARPMSGSGRLWGQAFYDAGTQAGKNPWYDTYADFSEDIRRQGQDYSIIPEFRVSEHMGYYLDEQAGNFFAEKDGLFELTGATYADSSHDNFFKVYNTSDFLKHFDAVKDHHENYMEPAFIKLKCKAIKKFLPYDGFYPASRTLQLATLFSQSYGVETTLAHSALPEGVLRNISLKPFFAPGIMYNTIKAGIAVDYPVFTSMSHGENIGTRGNYGNQSNTYALTGNFDLRLPFDAIVDPERYILSPGAIDRGPGEIKIFEAEPDPHAAYLTGQSYSGVPQTASVVVNSVDSNTYKLAAHNFLAESINLFLKDGRMTTFVSSPENHARFGLTDTRHKTYKMRVLLTNTKQYRGMAPEFFMYYNQSAFGPAVTCGQVGGNYFHGYMPFTPSYYPDSDSNRGYSYVELEFKPPKEGVGATKATAAFTINSATTNSDYITLISADGTSETYASSDDGSFSNGDVDPANGNVIFKGTGAGSAAASLTALAAAINHVNGHKGKITASAASNTITLTQDEPGVEGNTQITVPATMAVLITSAPENSSFSGGTNAGVIHKYTLNEILTNLTSSFYRAIGSSTTKDSCVDNQMHLTASVNIFGRAQVKKTTYDAITGQPATVEDSPADNLDVWVIQPKFETPHFNFAKYIDFEDGTITSTADYIDPDADSYKPYLGMWHQYGEIETDNNKGIFLAVQDVPNPTPTTGSLADLVGFNNSWEKLGQLPHDSEMSIKEAVVAIPFKRKLNKRTRAVETQFFNIKWQLIDRAKSAIEKGIPQSESGVSKSIYNMVASMKEYVIPPKFDFLTRLEEFKSKRKVKPFAMYFFEFEHEFSRQDIGDMWQNLPPKLGTSFEEAEACITHPLLMGELMSDLDSQKIQWLVFKVKQKAKTNYFQMTLDAADDERFKFDFNIGRKSASGKLSSPLYSYNWPYDYCSIVELARLEASVLFGPEKGEEERAALEDNDGESNERAKISTVAPTPPRSRTNTMNRPAVTQELQTRVRGKGSQDVKNMTISKRTGDR